MRTFAGRIGFAVVGLAAAAHASPGRVSLLASPGLLADPYGDLDFNPAYVNRLDDWLVYVRATGSASHDDRWYETYRFGM
jgi:hypothetical protein